MPFALCASRFCFLLVNAFRYDSAAAKEDCMLLFLSSGARPRYREDIVRTLALPPGGRLQFRYDLSIVDETVVNDTKSGKLFGQRALVCYLWNRVEGAPTEYVPCRAVEVTAAEIVGSSFVVVFKVGDYANVTDTSSFASSIEDERLPRWQREGSKFKLRGLFVIALKREPRIDFAGNLNAFETIVKALCNFSDFSVDTQQFFFVILGVARIGQEVFQTVPMSQSGSYHLVSGEEYQLKTYVFAPEASPTATIKETAIHIHSENKLIEFPLGKSREIDSEYDIKRFRFLTDRSLFEIAASLILFVHEKHAIAEGTREIILPVAFAGRWHEGVSRAFLVAAGSSVPAMIAAQAAGTLGFWSGLLMFGVAFGAGIATVFLLPSRKG
jgi:hypothetical protein